MNSEPSPKDSKSSKDSNDRRKSYRKTHSLGHSDNSNSDNGTGHSPSSLLGVWRLSSSSPGLKTRPGPTFGEQEWFDNYVRSADTESFSNGTDTEVPLFWGPSNMQEEKVTTYSGGDSSKESALARARHESYEAWIEGHEAHIVDVPHDLWVRLSSDLRALGYSIIDDTVGSSDCFGKTPHHYLVRYERDQHAPEIDEGSSESRDVP